MGSRALSSWALIPFLAVALLAQRASASALLDGDAGALHNQHELWAAMALRPVTSPAPAPEPARGAPAGAHANLLRRLQAGGSQVSFSAAQLARSGDEVTVTAIVDPALVGDSSWDALAPNIYVAVYAEPSPGGAIDLAASTPARYQVCVADEKFRSTGEASFVLKLYNLGSGGFSAFLISGGIQGSDTAPAGLQDTWVTGGAKPWVSLTGMTDSSGFAGEVLAQSPAVLTFARPNEPTMIRVSAGPSGVGSELRVTWNMALGAADGYLLWSTSPDLDANTSAVARVEAGNATTLTKEDVCAKGPASSVGFRDFGSQFSVVLAFDASLQGSSVYFAVGAATGGGGQSDAQRLRVPFAPGVFTGAPQVFLSWADQGVGFADDSVSGRNYNNGVISLATTRALSDELADIDADGMVLQGLTVAGDVAYADGYLQQWQDYFEVNEDVISTAPLCFAGGNHEAAWYYGSQYNSPSNKTTSGSYWNSAKSPGDSISSGGECGVAWRLLPTASATPAAPWYAFRAGLTTLIAFSSEHDLAPGSPQHSWLEATLKSVDRSATPWVVVFGHRSVYVKPSAKSEPNGWPYSDAKRAGDANVMQVFQASLEPLLAAYGVDVVYGGHTHVTQRMCASYRGKCETPSARNADDGFEEYAQPRFPVYFVLGSAGANFDITSPANPPPFLDWDAQAFAIGKIVVRNASILEVEIIDVRTGATIDRSRIVKDHSSPLTPLPSPEPTGYAPPGERDTPEFERAVGGTLGAMVLLALAAYIYHPRRDKSITSASKGAAEEPVVLEFGGAARAH